MSVLEKMTLAELRALARERLGPGHSRYTKKADLVRALEDVGVGGGRGAGKGAAAKKGTAKKGASKPAASAQAKAPRPAGGKASGRAKAPAAEPRAAQAPAPRAPEEGRGFEGADPEGYFVARVRGEEAMREAPHPMTEAGGGVPPALPEELGEPAWHERLGDLPWGYGDDAFLALPRDPTTLFVYWDFSRASVERAFEGLDHPRAQLWVFLRSAGGWDHLRSVEFALESRSFYVHDLEPGREYRAEIHAVDRHGRERILGRPSNAVGLPPVGPSAVVDDRFVRIPWDMPLGRIGAGHPGGPFSEEARALLARLSEWARATSSEGAVAGRGGPSSPSSPFGPLQPREG